MCSIPKSRPLPPPPPPPAAPTPNTARMVTPDEQAAETGGGSYSTVRSRLRIDPSNGAAGKPGLSIPA